SGDACNGGSTSPGHDQVVTANPTTVALGSSPNPSTCGQKLTLDATVSPAGVTGTVTFFEGATNLGSSPVDGSGHAMLSVTPTSSGTHTYTAVYSGDGCFAGSTSPDDDQVVNPAATTVALTSNSPKTTYGDKVTFTATVTPAGATGTVTF